MVSNKRVFNIATLALLVVILAGLIVSPAMGQPPEKVKVLIGFTHQPGPAEEALVRGVGGAIKYTYHLVPAIAATLPEPAISGLLANPNVTRIEPDGQVWAIDAELDNAWGVKHIGAGTVHDGGNKGAGIKVAVLDTGIDTDHPDLSYEAGCSKSFVGETLEDGHSHGTHVAGTIAALDNGGGVVGVAPEATLCIYKVLSDSGSGDYSDVIAALQQAVTDGVQVTNNSYGSSGDPGETVQQAFDTADAAGVVNVCAAGNSGNPPGKGDNVIYPAAYASCIAVAATDSKDKRASFSSTGPDVELAAPGVDIYSTLPGGGYGEKDGTSMASPHVAGTASLVIASGITDANENNRINDEVRQQLIETADDLGTAGLDPQYGYGLVDADGAAPPSPVSTGTIDGTVTESDGVTPIEGATVTVDTGQSGITDTDGTYTITDVPTGECSVTASADGFESQTKPATVYDKQTTTVDFALIPIPVGSITGTVINSENSEAISGATVTVDTGQSTTTGADGTYTITDVPTGDRLVTASADGFESQTTTATVTENNTTTVDFALNPVTPETPIRVQIKAGVDDVNSSCDFASGANEIYFGLDERCNELYYAGFRFENVQIPRGVNIISAHLEFTVDGPYNNDLIVVLQGEVTGNAAPFSETRWPSNLSKTEASVHWDIAGVWKSGTKVISPEIKSVIQEIINLGEWEQGNALIITGETIDWEKVRTSHRRVFAYERDSGAVLVIEYEP